MSNPASRPVKLFQFPRMLGVPNLSPFCCKLETWLRITRIPYEVVDTPDPRKGPKRKVPFIEDAGVRIGDSSIIVEHLKRTRGVDPDARLDVRQRSVALLVQRTLEEHYAFVVAHTHLVREEGLRHTSARFDPLPALLRPFVARAVRSQVEKTLSSQGVGRHSHEEIVDFALQDWRAVLTLMSGGPFFFGDEPTTVDAIVFGALATTVLTPIESPIREHLYSQPNCIAYAHRMLLQFFPELAATREDIAGSDPARSRVRST